MSPHKRPALILSGPFVRSDSPSSNGQRQTRDTLITQTRGMNRGIRLSAIDHLRLVCGHNAGGLRRWS
jgi:hypothetical protein